MSRVNVDAQAFLDARFARLAHKMGWAEADFAIGKMARLWLECTLRETNSLSEFDIAFAWHCDGENAAVCIEFSKLGVRFEDENGDPAVRFKGCKGRTDWLEKARKNGEHGKKGGRPKKPKNPDGSKTKNPDGFEKKTPPAPAPAPALVLSPAPAQKKEGVHAAAATALSLAAVSELNILTGRRFAHDSDAAITDCTALVKSKNPPTPEQAVAVVRAKVKQWAGDPKMQNQLKPSVLLRPSNFRRYLAEDVAAGSAIVSPTRRAIDNWGDEDDRASVIETRQLALQEQDR